MTATDTYLLLRAFVDELARCGLRDACTSPGSRCTPIVLTLAAEQRIRCWSHIDERCSGFFALGAAKASGRGVAITCTSGTAAANLAPAVIEAHHARVPLIVLTADRPPELRDVGAGQTIDQLKLYGDAAKWFFEVGVHEASPARMRFMRMLACRAYWTALDDRAGVVHLNFPLHEPLVLDAPLPPIPPDAEVSVAGRPDGQPWLTIDHGGRQPVTPRRHEFDRVVFVAGALGGNPVLGSELAAFAARARVPLLADPLSNARSGDAAVAHYDLLLRDQTTAAELAPQLVCRIGDLPTSKPLRAWLSRLDVPQVAFAGDDALHDPDSRLTQRTIGSLADLLGRLSDDEVVPAAGDWLERWRAADALAAEAIGRELAGETATEPAVAAGLAAWLPPEAILFVASSMPIRDLESYMAVRADGPRVLSNRGANGIDGTVSAAFGTAAGSSGPVVLLTGDVALAHDIGGLLAARRTGLRLTIVLLNNDGGGIFHFLPVAGAGDAFESHVATPHGLDFSHAAALYDCDHQPAMTLDALRAGLEHALAGNRTTILEVRTQRTANRELHRKLEHAVLRALAEPGR
jgi:2-succinyl-5-enolpyruvyl-6-hydroxy-3-cyclohexene-1-carboxylate synthase